MVQESYFARKSSHSGTPMLAPLVEAVLAAGVVAVAGLSVVPDAALLLVFVFVSVVEQPIRKMANARQSYSSRSSHLLLLFRLSSRA